MPPDFVELGNLIAIGQHREIVSSVLHVSDRIAVIVAKVNGQDSDLITGLETNALEMRHQRFAVGTPGCPEENDDRLLGHDVTQCDGFPACRLQCPVGRYACFLGHSIAAKEQAECCNQKCGSHRSDDHPPTRFITGSAV